MSKQNSLIIIDYKNKKVLNEVKLPGVTHWATNTVDNKIYLADDFGRIICIQPIEY